MAGPDTALRLPVIDALVAVVAAVALLIMGGGLLLPLGGAGVAIAQIAFVALPTVVIAAFRGKPAARLGLVNPGSGALLGAALIGASLWFITLWLIAPLSEMWFDTSELERLEAMAEAMPPVLMIVGFAIAPAICEELLFRGALARSLVPRLGPTGAVVISAVLFAGFHASAARLLPTLFIGLALGAVTVRSRSVLPAMVLHGLNNGIALSISEDWIGWLEAYSAVLGITAICATGGGFWLVWRSTADRESTT